MIIDVYLLSLKYAAQCTKAEVVVGCTWFQNLKDKSYQRCSHLLMLYTRTQVSSHFMAFMCFEHMLFLGEIEQREAFLRMLTVIYLFSFNKMYLMNSGNEINLTYNIFVTCSYSRYTPFDYITPFHPILDLINHKSGRRLNLQIFSHMVNVLAASLMERL